MQVRYQLRHSPEVRRSYDIRVLAAKSARGVPSKQERVRTAIEGVARMLAYLPFLVWFVLLLYSLLDIDRTPDGAIRGLSVGGWFAVVLLVPILGALAWLALGRPHGARHPALAHGAALAGPQPEAPAIEWIPPAQAQRDDRLQAILDRIDREFDEAVRRSRERHRRSGP